jgi:CYTH domain-containing protein
LWHEGLWWAIDEFAGENAGRVMAEIELASPEQPFSRPAWLGPEVTFRSALPQLSPGSIRGRAGYGLI